MALRRIHALQRFRKVTMVQTLKNICLLFFLFNTQLAFADDHEEVTCGSVVKFTHVHTGVGKYLLFSEEKKLNVGSGQQLVTWVKDRPESNKSLWWIRPRHHNDDREYHPNPNDVAKTVNSCTQAGEPIKCNSIIRLTHMDTMKNLHSHGVPSALSKQQEVTAFGQGDAKGDNGDNWEVVCNTEYWMRNENVKLRHVDTKAYLGASFEAEFNRKTCGNNCPLMDHLEAFGRKTKDLLSDVQVDLGIHIYL